MKLASAPLSQGAHPTQWPARWALLVVIGGIITVTLLHYLTSAHMLPYHSIYRTLYYVPITVAAVALGQRAGLLAAAVVILAYLPHVVGMGETMPGGLFDNLLELPLFVLIAALVGAISDRERRAQRHSERLRAYVDAVLQSLPVGVATGEPGAPPLARNRAAQLLLPALASDTAVTALPAGYHTLDGGQRPMGVYVSPLRQGTDDGDERVYVLEDLTERRALELQLRRVDRLASVGQLAAGIAHEVRNPLAILRATAQLLAGQLDGDLAAARYTEVLTSESDRIDSLVGQLLDYARPRPLVLVRRDLAALLRAAAAQIHPYAVQREVAVVVDAPEGCTVAIDDEQISQLLLNLLLNAVQASPPGSTVLLRGTRHPGDLTLVVSDTGSGMAPAVQERACDPFFTTRSDGTGLGLALVAAIVHHHGGVLRFDSRVGVGTTVTVTLPQEAPDGLRPHY